MPTRAEIAEIRKPLSSRTRTPWHNWTRVELVIEREKSACLLILRLILSVIDLFLSVPSDIRWWRERRGAFDRAIALLDVHGVRSLDELPVDSEREAELSSTAPVPTASPRSC